jgi:hypothetical protein
VRIQRGHHEVIEVYGKGKVEHELRPCYEEENKYGTT